MGKLALLILFTISISASAQKRTAWVSGRLTGENENPLARVSVIILGKTTGSLTDDSGYFRIKVPADRAFALVFSHAGYNEAQKNFYLSDGGREDQYSHGARPAHIGNRCRD